MITPIIMPNIVLTAAALAANRATQAAALGVVTRSSRHHGGSHIWTDGMLHPRETLTFMEAIPNDRGETLTDWKATECCPSCKMSVGEPMPKVCRHCGYTQHVYVSTILRAYRFIRLSDGSTVRQFKDGGQGRL